MSTPIGSLRRTADAWLNRRESWVWILGIGLAIRIVLLIIIGDQPLQSDALYYHQAGLRLAKGDLSNTYWPPGLPLYHAFWSLILGPAEWVARASMLLWFISLARGTYNFILRLHSRPAANLALIFLCLYPEFIHHSIEPLTQIPAAALLLAALNFTHRTTEGHERKLLTRLGITLGMLVLMRPASALLALLAPVWLFLRGRSLVTATWVGLTACAAPFAYSYLISTHHERTIILNDANARNLYLGNNPYTPDYKTWYLGSHWEGRPEIPPQFREELRRLHELMPAARYPAFSQAAWEHIRTEPGRFLIRVASRARVLFAYDTFTGARLHPPNGQHPILGKAVLITSALLFTSLLIFAMPLLLGTWRGEWTGSSRLLVIAAITAYVLPYLLSFSHPTFHLPLIPLLLAFASAPWADIVLPLGRPYKFPRGKRILVPAILSLAIIAIQVEWTIRMLN